jgi:hypothetical protein
MEKAQKKATSQTKWLVPDENCGRLISQFTPRSFISMGQLI